MSTSPRRYVANSRRLTRTRFASSRVCVGSHATAAEVSPKHSIGWWYPISAHSAIPPKQCAICRRREGAISSIPGKGVNMVSLASIVEGRSSSTDVSEACEHAYRNDRYTRYARSKNRARRPGSGSSSPRTRV